MIMKRLGMFLLNVVEIYIPLAAFFLMFCLFLLQIFFRYVLNQPLTWAFELTTMAFVWTVLLGAGYARRKQDHVAFTMIYDVLNAKKQAIFRIVGNGLIIVAFALAVYPVYDYLQFLYIQKSSVLRIPFNIAFMPFLVFLLLMIGHSVHDVWQDVKKLAAGEYSKACSAEECPEQIIS